MDETMRDYYQSLSNIYSHLAAIAEEQGKMDESERLVRMSFRFDMMSNA